MNKASEFVISDLRQELQKKPNFRYYCLAKVHGGRLVIDTQNWTYSYRLAYDLGLPKKEVVLAYNESIESYYRIFKVNKNSRGDYIVPSAYHNSTNITGGSEVFIQYKFKRHVLEVIYVDWIRELFSYNENMLAMYVASADYFLYDKPILELVHSGNFISDNTWKSLM